jgi:hypothetical protein
MEFRARGIRFKSGTALATVKLDETARASEPLSEMTGRRGIRKKASQDILRNEREGRGLSFGFILLFILRVEKPSI